MRRLLVVPALLWAFGVQAAECDQKALAAHPKAKPVADAAAALRQAAAKPDASFSKLLAQTLALAAQGKSSLDQLQEAGCSLDEAAMANFEACFAPLSFSCESVPPDIDWSVLKSVHRADDEELAFALGETTLAGPANLFATCCSDSGCTEGGVGLPPLLSKKDDIAKLARLAGLETPLGKSALDTLRKSKEALQHAKCACDSVSAGDLKTAVNALMAETKAATPAAAPLRSLAAALSKGFPKVQCSSGGGE